MSNIILSSCKLLEEEYLEYDWKKIPTGSTFTCIIDGVKCSGRIYKDKSLGKIYLCQNSIISYASPIKLSYKYSWCIKSGSLNDCIDSDVTKLMVWLPEKDYFIQEELLQFETYTAITSSNNVKIGPILLSYDEVQAIYIAMSKLRLI